MNETLWWHVYGGELPDITEYPDGSLGPGWGQIILGESTRPPKDMPNTLQKLGVSSSVVDHFEYQSSFNYDPSHEEREALTPEEYRNDDS